MSKKWGILYIPLSCFLVKLYTTTEWPGSFDIYLNKEKLNASRYGKKEGEEYEILSMVRKTKPNLKKWFVALDKTLASHGMLTCFEMLEMDVNEEFTFQLEEFEVVEIPSD